jgi:hypothetical protein
MNPDIPEEIEQRQVQCKRRRTEGCEDDGREHPDIGHDKDMQKDHENDQGRQPKAEGIDGTQESQNSEKQHPVRSGFCPGETAPEQEDGKDARGWGRSPSSRIEEGNAE